MTDNNLLKISEPAGADLTGKKFTVVKMNASGQVVPVTAIKTSHWVFFKTNPTQLESPHGWL